MMFYIKRELLTSLTFLRYRQTPCVLKRVKAHAEQREPSTLVLYASVNFADFQKQELKRTLHNMSVMSFAMLPYAVLFWVTHYNLWMISSKPIISTLGKSTCLSTSKWPSSVTTNFALAATAQSTNLSSSGSAVIN